jgi:hypothetical protein
MREDGGMQDDHDDYEPIIADRRPRRLQDDDYGQPLWRTVLALAAGVAIIIAIAWWYFERSSSSDVAATPQRSAPEFPVESLEEDRIAQVPEPVRDVEPEREVEQSPVPPPGFEPSEVVGETGDETVALDAEQETASASTPETAQDEDEETPIVPALLSVRITSPDPQVRVELRGGPDAASAVTNRPGDVIEIAPGSYRLVASGADLEPHEQEVMFQGDRSYELTVELCAEQAYERESLAGQIVEERKCSSTTECETVFMVLSEYADELVKDRAFRLQRCANWRSNAAPEGSWTLNTACGGATLDTTCSIEITQGTCSVALPRRSARGTNCPRVELQ